MEEINLTTEGCRYCLMCRHVCPVTRVTFSEASSPHGWALTIASLRRGLLEWTPQTVDLLYQCADCGLCQAHCVTDQPLPEAIVAARAAAVDLGHAPAALQQVEAALRERGNPWGEAPRTADAATADDALFVGATAWHAAPAEVEAAGALLRAVELRHTAIGIGRSSGYLPYTLGLHDIARSLAEATVEDVRRGQCRRLLTLSAEQAWTFRVLYPLLGVPLPRGVEVVELTVLLAERLDGGTLRLRPAECELAYHDACHTPRLAGRWHAPRRLLAALGRAPREGFWREHRATSCGASGGLPFTQPELARSMALAALADLPTGTTVVTDAPGCLAHLRDNAGERDVRGLYTLLEEHITE